MFQSASDRVWHCNRALRSSHGDAVTRSRARIRRTARLNIDDYLYACVEAGVGLSGFAALALAVRSRATQDYTSHERILIANLVERGLVSAALALMPLLLQSFHVGERAVWSLCSGLFFVYGVSIVVLGIRARRSAGFRELAIGPRLFVPIFSIGVVVWLTQLVNVLPVGIERGPQWYLLAITWLLLSAGYVFWFILRAWIRSA